MVAGAGDVFSAHELSALLYFAGDGQQRLQFVRDCGAFEVELNCIHQLFISAQVVSCRRTMGALAKVAIVLCGDVGRDQLTIRLWQ